jgi:hypothetical protein
VRAYQNVGAPRTARIQETGQHHFDVDVTEEVAEDGLPAFVIDRREWGVRMARAHELAGFRRAAHDGQELDVQALYRMAQLLGAGVGDLVTGGPGGARECGYRVETAET